MKPKGMFSCSHGKVLDLSVMLQMISPFVAGSKNLNASTLYQNLSLVMKMDTQWFIGLVNYDLVYCRDLVQYVNLATEMFKSYHRDDSI